MTLSDEDRRRIEEEEYRKLARERLERTERIEAEIRLERTERIEAEIRTTGDQQIAPPAQAQPETQANTVAATDPLRIFGPPALVLVAGAATVAGAVAFAPLAVLGGALCAYNVVRELTKKK
jgi:hypothetical protein